MLSALLHQLSVLDGMLLWSFCIVADSHSTSNESPVVCESQRRYSISLRELNAQDNDDLLVLSN